MTAITITKEQVRSARTKAKLTQARAAEMVHISTRMWRKYEAGESPIHPAFWELFIFKANLYFEMTKK